MSSKRGAPPGHVRLKNPINLPTVTNFLGEDGAPNLQNYNSQLQALMGQVRDMEKQISALSGEGQAEKTPNLTARTLTKHTEKMQQPMAPPRMRWQREPPAQKAQRMLEKHEKMMFGIKLSH